ncbi:MAG TPA: C25 family cysteine peptidase [Clostridia bacterium]|nr:C25 family cysteine peptidase [Clostridia bacterium]
MSGFSPGQHHFAGKAMWFLLGAVLWWLFAASASSAVTQEAKLSATLRFEPPALFSTGGATSISVPGCATLRRIGAPEVPFRMVWLLLPPGADPASIELLVKASEVREHALPCVVQHGRMPRPYPGDAQVPAFPPNNPDPEIYDSPGLFPSGRAELASVQVIGGHKLAAIRIFPVQYSPALGKLFSVTDVTVDLEAATSLDDLPRKISTPDQFHRRLKRLALNPSMVREYEALQTPQDDAATVDYLLITSHALAPAFAPLVNAKTLCGLEVRTEFVESIATNFPGMDMPEKIRNCIRWAWQTLGVRYVLLGGDSFVVPCRYAYVYMGPLASDYLVPTDLYYACLDGSWNENHNSRFGEPTDGPGGGEVDLSAEVIIGRAPVETTAEAAVFVEKTLRYASMPFPEFPTALFMAEFLGAYPSGPAQGGDMFDPLGPYFAAYNVTWLDDRPYASPQWTGADAIMGMNQSPLLALFNGHGDYDRMMRLTALQVDSLTNEWPFLVCSVGCNAGQFDNDKWSPDAIGEELVKRHSRGAFAAVLNTREGWFDPADEWRWSGEFQMAFFERLLAVGQQGLAESLQVGRESMLGHVERAGAMPYRWCYYEITLLGDPHVLWGNAAPAEPVPLAIVSNADGGLRVWWPSEQGRAYGLEVCTNLLSGAYTTMEQSIPATPPINSYPLEPGAPAAFIRLRIK